MSELERLFLVRSSRSKRERLRDGSEQELRLNQSLRERERERERERDDVFYPKEVVLKSVKEIDFFGEKYLKMSSHCMTQDQAVDP